MSINSIIMSFFLAFMSSSAVNAQQVNNAPEPVQAGQFFYKLGTFKSTVLIVYVNSNFYDLYIWEKEQLLQPIFEQQLAVHAALTTIAIRDAKTGKTVGTYSPKTGAAML
jgi:hypothetical protein